MRIKAADMQVMRAQNLPFEKQMLQFNCITAVAAATPTATAIRSNQLRKHPA